MPTPGVTLDPNCIPVVKLKDPPPCAVTTLKDPPSCSTGMNHSTHTAPASVDNVDTDTPVTLSVSVTQNDVTIEPIQFKALQDDGKTLDIYAYHRGREGFELRDELTGDLLCDTDPVDTSHAAADDHKSMIVAVMIQVPIEHETTDSNDTTGAEAQKEIRYFRDSIQWDLADPETPNPMLFAAEIAQDFGLSYPQTWDLAESIQTQLQAFVHENFAYVAPMLITREQQQDKATPMVPLLYGEVTGFLQQGGTCYPVTQKPKAPPPQQLQRAGPVISGRTTASASAGNKGTSGKLPASKRRDCEDTRKAEEVFYHQVRVRLHKASVRDIETASRDSQGQSSAIRLYENHSCHLCHQKQPLSGVFPCGISNHSYCVNHLRDRLGLTYPNASLQLDYCPLCSLSCNCVNCVGKLDALAIDFKRKCVEQEATPETTVFADILGHCRKRKAHNAGDKKQTSRGKKSRHGVVDRRTSVPKMPRFEFPREVANGVDMDFGFDLDYRTIFSEKGSLLITAETAAAANGGEGNSSAVPCGEQSPLEDGSVDFCSICLKVGNLLCCDYCPRAFHSECIPREALQQDTIEETQWECPRCCKERDGLSEDKIDGRLSLTAICDAHRCATSTKDDLQNLKILSVLHDMLRLLMDYEFGYMFRSPVDFRQIPTYITIVDKPMDLGTISSNLLKGSYFNDSLENIVLAVLKDIELVWHNCFIFNVEGSAVFRMAEVQKRRALSIRKRSFDDLLSERVKQELADYVTALGVERDNYRRLESPKLQRKPSSTPTTQARHKIAGSARSSGKGRPVAVLDPDNGKLVKIYTTLHSASNAVNFFLNLNNHRCEWEPKDIDNQNKLRKVILLCQKDPSVRLYGLRWIFLDDLRNRSVAFVCRSKSRDNRDETAADTDEDPGIGLVEMVDGGISYFFSSIGEALSFPGLPDNIPDFSDRLHSLVPGADFVEVVGRMWRRFLPETTRSGLGGVIVRPSLQNPSAGSATEFTSDDMTRLSGVEFIKEDLIYGETTLAGFPHVMAAFQDWCQTLDASVVPFAGPRSLDVFVQYYLDSDRNIDGMRWRRVTRTEPDDSVERSKSAEPVERAAAPSLSGSQDDAESTTTSSQATENSRTSRAFNLETVSSPKPADQKSNAANGVVLNGLSENCQFPPNVSSRDDAGESIGRGESSVLSPALNKEATAVG